MHIHGRIPDNIKTVAFSIACTQVTKCIFRTAFHNLDNAREPSSSPYSSLPSLNAKYMDNQIESKGCTDSNELTSGPAMNLIPNSHQSTQSAVSTPAQAQEQSITSTGTPPTTTGFRSVCHGRVTRRSRTRRISDNRGNFKSNLQQTKPGKLRYTFVQHRM